MWALTIPRNGGFKGGLGGEAAEFPYGLIFFQQFLLKRVYFVMCSCADDDDDDHDNKSGNNENEKKNDNVVLLHLVCFLTVSIRVHTV